jgi:spermidine/putrescine transport system permease protein
MKKRWAALRGGYLGAILIVMYVPILIVIVYSFNESRLSSLWSGFSLRWYAELFRDRSLFDALRNSVVLALTASFSAAVIGTLGAVGARNSPGGSLRKGLEGLAILPIMIPEIILGMALLAFFAFLSLPLGMFSLAIAHTTFCIPYVYMVVKARLAGLEKTYVEAAKDLGAGEGRAFFDITLPLILPAVASGMLIAFAMSFDDVIVSVFVTGPSANTLPIRIFTQIKTGVTPKTNALCALLFVVTIALCLASAALGRFRKTEGETQR